MQTVRPFVLMDTSYAEARDDSSGSIFKPRCINEMAQLVDQVEVGEGREYTGHVVGNVSRDDTYFAATPA